MNWKVLTIPIIALFLVGCSITPKKKQVEVTTIALEKPPLNITNPPPLELRDVAWVIVTEANIDTVWQMLKDDKEGVALFALRHGDYERLALNIKDIRAQLGEYIVILKEYREYYESDPEE